MMPPTQEDIKEYEEFRDIYIENVNIDVGLLIGNDNRHILQPLEVVNSEVSHYAIKTHVGWVINCPSKTGSLPSYCKNFLIKTSNRLAQWFPIGEEFLPLEEFYNFKGGILQVLFCEGLWCLNCKSQMLALFFLFAVHFKCNIRLLVNVSSITN